ncbi:MAG: c-type cytochrome [Vulcanimicrobiaceae bacterium]
MQRSIVAGLRALCAAPFILIASSAQAGAVPVFANGQGISCETCHTTFPGMTRYGMSVMMTNFQILNEHLQNQALPIAARLYITSLLANKDHPGSTIVDDLSLLGGGFLGRNFTWYAEQHVIDSGVIGETEQAWVSWNGLLHGTNSIQVGKFHTPFPFMPAHAWTISPYLLAAQTTGQNSFNPNDARWGIAFTGMSNEFMYNVSWLTGSGPTIDALDYSKTVNPRTLDVNVSYGGMQIPWSVGLVGLRGYSPVSDPLTKDFLATNTFTREGVYLAYQDSAWHLQTMYYHGTDANPDIGLFNVPLNGVFFEVERDLNWRNHILVRYDAASSDKLGHQVLLDFAHNVLPNLALIGEIAAYPRARPQIAFRFAYAGPYQYGKRYLANLHVVPAGQAIVETPNATHNIAVATAATSPVPSSAAAPAAINEGAKLVQASGCAGCHGAGLKGGSVGPALYGIEHRLTNDQTADFIAHPRPPMPNFGFTSAQISDIVAYLSSLDGGANNEAPVVSFNPATPIDEATITVQFSGATPKDVSVLPIMQMGTNTMQTRLVHLTPQAGDPHVFTGRVVFSMGGPWTVRLQYDGKTLDVPLNVGQ